LLNHQTVIADALRDVRVVYYDVLVAQQLIAVQEILAQVAATGIG